MNGVWLFPGIPGIALELSPGTVVPAVAKPKKRKRKRSKR
jgi:hypothetical protein